MAFEIHIGPNIRKSPFFDATVADGVRGFSVYNHMYIPGHFGDPQAEYDRLLTGVAMWDVAAQRQVALQGPDALRLAQVLTPRNLSKTAIGQGRYVPICDHDGWLINDPVLLKLADDHIWLSVADSDIHLWAAAIAAERGLDVRVSEPDVSPLAIQGPRAMDVAAALLGPWVRDLRYFGFREVDLDGIPLVVARSGWSKQGGVELYLRDGAQGQALWDRVKTAGAPFGIGPGAPNDIERLESGLVSYGADMRWQSLRADPFEMGLGGLVDLDQAAEFVGKAALRRIAARPLRRQRLGVFLDGPPVTGNAHPLALHQGAARVGTLSEIAYSRRLGRNIGVGLIDVARAADKPLTVQIDGQPRRVEITPLPFQAG